ncbi:MAG TPA: nucleotidyltransferase family protein [Ferruginibacter sp.]|nr:nucleotidyltransferase family protein [Ferruginibacter sp.]
MNTPGISKHHVTPLGGGGGITAIILAGGLGTRLRSVVSEVPKCMAPVNGIPFIHFIVWFLKNEGIEHFIFSLGYKHEIITGYLDKTFPQLNKQYSIEQEPLGTGGAIKKALSLVQTDFAVVLNGDTMFNVHIGELVNTHQQKKASCTIALKEMKQFTRYGSVETDTDDRITAFNEKTYCEKGLINGGVYVINKNSLQDKELPESFSFERDYLEKFLASEKIFGVQNEYYFIDIGVPEDYQKFQDDYNLILSKKKYNKTGNTELLDDFFEGLASLTDF